MGFKWKPNIKLRLFCKQGQNMAQVKLTKYGSTELKASFQLQILIIKTILFPLTDWSASAAAQIFNLFKKLSVQLYCKVTIVLKWSEPVIISLLYLVFLYMS